MHLLHVDLCHTDGARLFLLEPLEDALPVELAVAAAQGYPLHLRVVRIWLCESEIANDTLLDIRLLLLALQCLVYFNKRFIHFLLLLFQ